MVHHCDRTRYYAPQIEAGLCRMKLAPRLRTSNISASSAQLSQTSHVHPTRIPSQAASYVVAIKM
ncbi:uncharacterized protein EI97DRAFT_212089 [Westerdykella ornata]|uniref:Uncharacterized protein n=1 Tax=Westerdykella ornata TaxID=318751 RepID=A0A6A6J9Q1_WESOR|nr:uncharacterized protein EI97DRAFT_212089 [Westerdykella ornata]KAF2272356.1 hypothetical protein EI97DRAFT_212089 [Westerdykella ornata]